MRPMTGAIGRLIPASPARRKLEDSIAFTVRLSSVDEDARSLHRQRTGAGGACGTHG